jgi:hypothetical protein
MSLLVRSLRGGRVLEAKLEGRGATYRFVETSYVRTSDGPGRRAHEHPSEGLREGSIVRRIVAVLAVAGSFAAVSFSPALAGGDGWEPLPADTFVLPSEVCGFPVEVSFLVNQEYAKTVSQDDDTLVLRVTGNLVQRLTNLDTGTFVDIHISGPALLTIDLSSGLLDVNGQGRSSLFFLAQDQEEFGITGILLVSGHLHEIFDPATSDVSELAVSGHVEELCSELG